MQEDGNERIGTAHRLGALRGPAIALGQLSHGVRLVTSRTLPLDTPLSWVRTRRHPARYELRHEAAAVAVLDFEGGDASPAMASCDGVNWLFSRKGHVMPSLTIESAEAGTAQTVRLSDRMSFGLHGEVVTWRRRHGGGMFVDAGGRPLVEFVRRIRWFLRSVDLVGVTPAGNSSAHLALLLPLGRYLLQTNDYDDAVNAAAGSIGAIV